MSVIPTSSITRQATRDSKEPLNVLTFPTHERYETGLCLTGHNFYAWRGEGIKDWNTQYAPVPKNYILLNGNLPLSVDFDVILSQNKFGQFQIASQFARQLHLPLISLEHTLPVKEWPKQRLEACQHMRGDINLFISEFSLGEWGWQKDSSTHVIHHMVDTNIFDYDMLKDRKSVCLSVVNDWINRDYFCGFNLWRQVTQDLPVKVIGDTPGLSKPAFSTEDLVNHYNSSLIFVNTSLISPIPTALLEAMACGCACVSTATCMIPEIITEEIKRTKYKIIFR